MTDGEKLLWRRLRYDGIGYRFRRQHSIGPYVLDFFCAAARLCVEIDGEFHALRADADNVRDEWLRAQGIETVRIPSWDVFNHLDCVVQLIGQTCEERCGPP
jgi:very-short-patch-repair endonuclease